MGLFDIFRRRKKEKKPTEQAAPATETDQQTADQKPEQSDAQQSVTSMSDQAADKPAADHDQPASQAKAAEQPTVSVEDQQPTAEEQQETIDEPEPASTPDQESSADQATSTDSQSAPAAADTQKAQETTPVEEATATADVKEGEEAASSSVEEQTANTEAEKQETARYDRGLKKSRTGFGARLNRFLANFRHVDEDFFEDLEDLLIESDVGVDMAMKLSDELRDEVKLQNAHSKQDVSNVIIEKMVDLYEEAGAGENNSINWAAQGPTVIMFVGVNGAGKTTTIGKMAAREKKNGKKVLLAAADTFRAGATEQLAVWADRDGVDIVTGPENGDPAAVVFDAVKKAKEEDYDVLFVDTAGRLQNKVNLMKELAKMKRILTREIPDAPHEVLLVLDATTGQNALTQAKLFKESTDVTGIVLTKLDGTARGGIVLAIRNELHLPVKFVGLGEQVDDLQAFDPSEFVYGLFKGLVEE